MASKQYELWSEAEQTQLLKAVHESSMHKKLINWQYVSLQCNKSPARCKSYYQFFQKKQSECARLWISNKSYMSQAQKRIRIHIGVYAQFYNFDWEFIQKQFYSAMNIDEIKNIYIHSLRMFQLQRSYLANNTETRVEYPVQKLKEMYNNILGVNQYIKLYKRFLMFENSAESVQNIIDQTYQDAPQNEQLFDQIDPIIAEYYIELTKGYDLGEQAAKLKMKIENKGQQNNNTINEENK
ncbi:Hypothetical_protein [Hexamita inflata]|uniref:Hypothetical_protein n=1 Tax=Hexamita inflata TaxID=28002 RepID=A0AA86NWQ2_9EUKA|nr:Hypothetical protein HINF_LOCUS14899 [Hexamita inflata]